MAQPDPSPGTGAPHARLDAGLALACAVGPALFAALHAGGTFDAAHAEGAVRALGLGWTGALRGPDALLAGMMDFVPLGTRALRAALGSALACGAASMLLYAMGRRLLLATAPDAPRLARALAAVGALLGALSAVVQIEAGVPAGGALSLLLALAPLACAALGARPLALGLALGLAAAEEPLALALGAAAVLAHHVVRERGVRRPSVRAGALFGAGLAFGLAPLVVTIAARDLAPDVSTTHALFAAPLGEGAGRAELATWLPEAVGIPSLLLALAGAVVALRVREARPLVAGLLALALVGALGVAVGAPAGGARASVAAMALVCSAAVLAGAGMLAVALAVARVPVPFAHASSVMIVLLACAFPVRAADEASLALDARKPGASLAWTRGAFGTLEPGAFVLLSDARTVRLAMAARASGELRGDLTLLPLGDAAGPLATRAILGDPLLAGIVRDALLGGAPEELSLARLAGVRPTYVTFDAKWDRALARHLVPGVGFDRFYPEPRGPSDRRQAREKLAAERDRWIRAATHPPGEELARASAALLRGRAIACAAAGDRDAVGAALGDLQRASPGDPVGAELARRVVLGKGPVSLEGLPGGP